MVGIQSHGQGLETALSQIAAQKLGIDPARIAVRHGDTESTAFGLAMSEWIGRAAGGKGFAGLGLPRSRARNVVRDGAQALA